MSATSRIVGRARDRRWPIMTAPKRMLTGSPAKAMRLAAPVMAIPSDLERSKAERAALYRSPAWRRERREFLRLNPRCGCGKPATVADHRDGHQHHDWRARFWDRSRWQPFCRDCHAAKSARELAAWNRTGGTHARG